MIVPQTEYGNPTWLREHRGHDSTVGWTFGKRNRLPDDNGAPIGIVHRDVSPSNLLISFEGEVKLCDFGIARANDMADALPEEGFKGKAGYMSPEHAAGKPVDARADLFAIGIVLWELLAGRKLYRVAKDNPKPTLLEQARAAQIPDIPARDLPNEDTVHAIVRRALSVNPDERYPTAQSMLRDLEDYVGQSGLMANPIRFGEWLRLHFEEDVVSLRRARERVAKAMQLGPLTVIEPYDHTPPPAGQQVVSDGSPPRVRAWWTTPRTIAVVVVVVVVGVAIVLLAMR